MFQLQPIQPYHLIPTNQLGFSTASQPRKYPKWRSPSSQRFHPNETTGRDRTAGWFRAIDIERSPDGSRPRRPATCRPGGTGDPAPPLASMPLSEHTASAASSVHPPENTVRRRSRRRSASVQQLVAPVDGRLERSLPRDGRARAACQQPEPILQSGIDLLDRQHLHPGSRELDRERNTIQPPADLRDSVRVGPRQREGRHRTGPIDEQLDGVKPEHLLQLQALGVLWDCQRGDGPDGFALNTQALAARRQNAKLRGVAQ